MGAGERGRPRRRAAAGGCTGSLALLVTGLPMPPGAETGVTPSALQDVVWEALNVPDLPAEAVDTAADRVQWLLGYYGPDTL